MFLYPKAQEHIQNFAPINVHNGNNQSLIVFFLYYGMLLFQKAPYQVQDNARLSANLNGKAAKAGLIAKAKVIADDADKSWLTFCSFKVVVPLITYVTVFLGFAPEKISVSFET